MHGSRFLSLAGLVAVAAASLRFVVAVAEPFVRLAEALFQLAFPAAVPTTFRLATIETPAVLGRVQTRAFLSRRASRDEGRRHGHWAMAGPQLAV